MLRTLLSVCFLTLLLFSATLREHLKSQETSQSVAKSGKNTLMRSLNNGAWWNTLSPDSKSDFVDGYVSAMADVHQMLMAIVKQNSKELTPGDPKLKFDTQMSATIQLGVIAERYEYEEVGRTKLLAGMDSFYKEPLNKLIPIEFAFAWERDTLNGKVAPRDLQKQLDEWRATMNK